MSAADDAANAGDAQIGPAAQALRRVVVVGGGTAGSVLAARLSEQPDQEVILVEAGPAGDTPAELLDGSTIPAAVPGHPVNWGYRSELTPGTETIVPRGRLLGGSSAINGGYFVRARPGDFERWARAGGPAWEYTAMLPLLAELETDLDAIDGSVPAESGLDSDPHGDSGPVQVRRPPQDGELTAAFTAAARELGFPEEPDKNALVGTPASAPGVGPIPSNIVDGIRVNTAMSYLAEAWGRSNLTIIGDTRATRVIIKGGQAIGVEIADTAAARRNERADEAHLAQPDEARVWQPGETARIDADEVILCAGAVATAQLLMLSGIGPRAELEALGLPVVADLPVGEGFHDHPNLALGWHPARTVIETGQRTAFPTALNFDSTTVHPEGDAPAASAAQGRAAPEPHPDGDLEVLLTAQPDEALFGTASGTVAAVAPPAITPGSELRLIVALQQPRSRGRLSLRSDDPLEPPRIEYRYLEHRDDATRLRVGVRTAAAILRSRAFRGLFGRFSSIDERVLSDDALLDRWIREHLGTAIHMCGTAPMGQEGDAAAVVDGAGRVHGVPGLRVADTSILPSAPSRGPFNTAVLIGEFVARSMREQD